jgi:hypothetical protein
MIILEYYHHFDVSAREDESPSARIDLRGKSQALVSARRWKFGQKRGDITCKSFYPYRNQTYLIVEKMRPIVEPGKTRIEWKCASTNLPKYHQYYTNTRHRNVVKSSMMTSQRIHQAPPSGLKLWLIIPPE